MRFVKPLDRELIEKVSKTHKVLITVEEGVIEGGIGHAECLSFLPSDYIRKCCRF